MEKKRVILFDLDGTLVDTERIALDIILAYFRELGREVTVNDLQLVVGRTWSSGVQALLERHPLPLSPKHVEGEVLTRYREYLGRSVPEIPGAGRAIRDLSAAYRLGVVSGSHVIDIELALRSLGVRDRVEHVIGFEDYEVSKPDPKSYLLALERFSVSPADVLVFEDSRAGVQAAVNAGLKVVAVGEPLHGAGERPRTAWKIPDFNLVDLNWVHQCFTAGAS